MNDLFKKLAAEADDYAAEKARDGFTNYQLAYDRKYAELIVRECISIASTAKSLEAAANIKQHFGIKE